MDDIVLLWLPLTNSDGRRVGSSSTSNPESESGASVAWIGDCRLCWLILLFNWIACCWLGFGAFSGGGNGGGGGPATKQNTFSQSYSWKTRSQYKPLSLVAGADTTRFNNLVLFNEILFVWSIPFRCANCLFRSAMSSGEQTLSYVSFLLKLLFKWLFLLMLFFLLLKISFNFFWLSCFSFNLLRLWMILSWLFSF